MTKQLLHIHTNTYYKQTHRHTHLAFIKIDITLLYNNNKKMQKYLPVIFTLHDTLSKLCMAYI